MNPAAPSNPAPTSNASAPQKPRVLFVDDEPLVLEGLRRSIYREFTVDIATSPEEGLQKAQAESPYTVIVSDMRMPNMDGAEFLARIRVLSPDSVRVMLTGYADVESATRAVNEGSIFRFLNKPISPDELMTTLRACVTQYELKRGEKELLENTLSGAVRVLSEVLNLANPVAFNKGSRICGYVRHMAAKMCLRDVWQFELAAMLSELGCVTLTPDLLEAIHAGETLSDDDQQRYDKHPKIAHDLLVRIPRLELVAEMILRQNETRVSLTLPKTPNEEIVLIGSRMLKVALAFDRLLSTGAETAEALATLKHNPAEYDAKTVAALDDFRPSRQSRELRSIDARDIRTGMILNEDLRSTTGMLLAAKGQEVSHALVKAIRNFVEKGTVKGNVLVTVNTGSTWVAKAAAR